MAAKMLLSSHPQPLCSPPFPTKLSTRGLTHQQVHPWLGWEQNPSRPKKLPLLHVSLHDPASSSSTLMDYIAHQHQQNPYSLVLLAESVGYSVASYYTSLGLFVISVPGLWSLIKRSVKSKVTPRVLYFSVCCYFSMFRWRFRSNYFIGWGNRLCRRHI